MRRRKVPVKRKPRDLNFLAKGTHTHEQPTGTQLIRQQFQRLSVARSSAGIYPRARTEAGNWVSNEPLNVSGDSCPKIIKHDGLARNGNNCNIFRGVSSVAGPHKLAPSIRSSERTTCAFFGTGLPKLPSNSQLGRSFRRRTPCNTCPGLHIAHSSHDILTCHFLSRSLAGVCRKSVLKPKKSKKEFWFLNFFPSDRRHNDAICGTLRLVNSACGRVRILVHSRLAPRGMIC
jgi:hypothetical protein